MRLSERTVTHISQMSEQTKQETKRLIDADELFRLIAMGKREWNLQNRSHYANGRVDGLNAVIEMINRLLEESRVSE